MRFNLTHTDLCWKGQRREGERKRKIEIEGKGEVKRKERKIGPQEKMIFIHVSILMF